MIRNVIVIGGKNSVCLSLLKVLTLFLSIFTYFSIYLSSKFMNVFIVSFF